MLTYQQTTAPQTVDTFRVPAPAVLGVAAYLVGLGLPVGWRLPLLLLGMSLLLQLGSNVASPRPARRSSSLWWMVVAFVLSFAGSTWASSDVARSALLAAALLPGLLAFVALDVNCLSGEDLSVLGAAAWAATCAAGASIVMAAVLHPNDSPFELVSHAGVAAIVVPNDAVFLALLAPVSLAMVRAAAPWKRVAGSVGLALAVLAIGVLASRIAVLTLVVALGVSLWLDRPRNALAGMVLLAALSFVVDGARGWPMLAKLSHPVDPRLSLWAVEWRFFTDAPLLGRGPFTLAANYEPTLARLALPAWLPRDPQATVPWAHNLWLEALGERGLVGLVALVLLLGGALRAALRRAAEATTADARRVVPLASLAALLVASFFELTLLHEWVGLAVFALAAIVHTPDRADRRS